MDASFYGRALAYFEEKNCGHTAAEIAQQPRLWRVLCQILQENKVAIQNFMTKAGKARVVLTGAGSSGFIGQSVADFAAKSTGVSYSPIHTTDIVSAPDIYLQAGTPTLLVSFARSGNSPESVGAVQYARKIVKDLYEVAIVCDGQSSLSKITQESAKSLLLVMPEGANDKGFAMTSSVSCMTLAGFALLNSGKIDEVCKEIPLLANIVEAQSAKMAQAAETCVSWDFERAWYLGSGAFKGLVQEGALKMMELTNGAVVAGFDSGPGFRHGPKTVMNNKTLTLHFLSSDPFTYVYDLDLLKELYQQKDKNRIAALFNENTEASADITIPYTQRGLSLLSHVAAGLQGLVFMQMLSMFKSLALDVPTDNPSPKGLVNRVVQGVTVYDCP